MFEKQTCSLTPEQTHGEEGTRDDPLTATITMNLMKSLVISRRHGIRVPQYGERLRMEHMRGTMKSASREKTLKARSVIWPSSLAMPMIPAAVSHGKPRACAEP